ncbi:GAP1-N2 domain-containing protein [Actinomadura rudentiformis]|uniref:Uncharacterized protein n=1 Tax=Actinomadura rudentiformis TaxID=359158 RepID=A0A6H9YW56_9ACTN|nr:hypothetical protein [Actinomadura rudentiformis]KAB2345078.1 hypothetical protein F8566_27745 [Actinomadura rudentiformis]
MAWQLHYTSARSGPTGRAGFQFVAETPGLPEGLRAAVTPHLSYRPPPSAPLNPDDGELGRFPVTFLYDRAGERALLLWCRYLGQDYSGRYGNFFAHAVVADPDELEGLRPAELWRAPLWSPHPEDAGELPDLDELIPGAAFEPEMLAEWLAEACPGDDKDAPYGLLARLMDAVVAVLGQGHGRVVLVADDVEQVARWIAVVSYSLPVAAAARMSFVTYSADPGGAAQRLVGTTPDVWASAQHHTTALLSIDLRHAAGGAGTSAEAGAGRFGWTVARCWQAQDFAGLDALGELALLEPDRVDPGVLDQAAGLLALCRGDAAISAEEEAAVAGILTRHGRAVPEWVWRDLVRGVPSIGFDLALAIHDWARDAGARDVAGQCALRATVIALSDPSVRDRLPAYALPAGSHDGLAPQVSAALAAAPDLTEAVRVVAVAAGAGAVPSPAEVTAVAAERAETGAADLPTALSACPPGAREPLLTGVLAGLAAADEKTRHAVLTNTACDLLFEQEPDRLATTPAVGLTVLASVGHRRRDRRLEVTGELLRIGRGAGELDPPLSRVWARPPTVAECLELLEAHSGAMLEHPALSVLPSRTFARSATSGDAAALAEAATLRLAARTRTLLPGTGAERDGAAVQAYADAVTAERPERAAAAFGSMIGAGASPRLAEAAFDGAARRVARRDPRFRAALLAAASGTVRARLAAAWTADPVSSRRALARPSLRSAENARRNELVEIVLRLRMRGITEPSLEAWARTALSRFLPSRQLEAHFSGDRELRGALRDLIAETRGAGRGD